jgi:hypothetical protein
MTIIRSKFQLQEIRQHSWNKNQRTFVFNCIYDSSIPEDQRFLDATPSGHMEITVNNPAVIAEWKLGEYYYFDAVPVAAETVTA